MVAAVAWHGCCVAGQLRLRLRLHRALLHRVWVRHLRLHLCLRMQPHLHPCLPVAGWRATARG